MRVGDICVKEVVCATPANSAADVAAMMKRHGIGIVPVWDEDHMAGVITDRDIVVQCVAAGVDSKKCHVSEFMTANPVTVSPETDLEEAARMMGSEQIRRLPVVENGKLVGIISLSDIAVTLSGKESLLAKTLRRISTPTRAVPVCP